MIKRGRASFSRSVSLASLFLACTFTGGGLTQQVLARSYLFEGKCGFLLDASYQERCSALFDDDVLTLMPKGSRQVRILPQQIVYVALADKSTMKVDETLQLYENAVPWWQPWNKVPGWVKDAAKKNVQTHQFAIGYVDKNFNPKVVLFVMNEKGKAAGMAAELQDASGLSLGETRRADQAIDSRLSRRLTKDVRRQAHRLVGMCSSWMFDDAQPVADALDSFVQNTNQEISIFDGSDAVAAKLSATAKQAFDLCDKEIKREIAEAAAAERARLEAIRRRQAQARRARAAANARAAERARLDTRAAWDSLCGN